MYGIPKPRIQERTMDDVNQLIESAANDATYKNCKKNGGNDGLKRTTKR